MLAFAVALEVRADVQIEKGPVSSNYKISGKKDEHRFGVELEENKQFHHTITGSECLDAFNYRKLSFLYSVLN